MRESILDSLARKLWRGTRPFYENEGRYILRRWPIAKSFILDGLAFKLRRGVRPFYENRRRHTDETQRLRVDFRGMVPPPGSDYGPQGFFYTDLDVGPDGVIEVLEGQTIPWQRLSGRSFRVVSKVVEAYHPTEGTPATFRFNVKPPKEG